jgi:hypothetical protein
VAVLLFAVVAGDFLVTSPTGVFTGVSQEAPADVVASTAPMEEPRALEYEVESTVVVEAEPAEKVALAPSPTPVAEQALPAESLRADEEAAPTEAEGGGGVGVQSSGPPLGETEEAEAVAESVPPAPSASEPARTGVAEDQPVATPTPRPTEAPPTVVPTAVAEVREPSAPEPWVGEEEAPQPEVHRDQRVLWFGVAELALGILFVLLVATTILVMIRQRRAR